MKKGLKRKKKKRKNYIIRNCASCSRATKPASHHY